MGEWYGKRRGRQGRLGRALAGLVAWVALVGAAQADDRPVIVTTFTILGDFAEQVAGEAADVRVLAPVGAEVHEYELRPADFRDLEAADVVFYNGYNLEQWRGQVEAAVGDGVPVVALGEASGVATRPIVTGDFEGAPDPHLWMDPRAAKAYVSVIADTLSEVAPERAETYRANADAYRASLKTLHGELAEALAAVPDEARTLITSEAAFLYFAAAYDFHHDGIWGTNTETEGTPRQMMRVIDVIREREPRAVFWESTISSRYVDGVADDTGVPVAGPLYVDSLGEPGSGAEGYLEMMQVNGQTIVEALGDE